MFSTSSLAWKRCSGSPTNRGREQRVPSVAEGEPRNQKRQKRRQPTSGEQTEMDLRKEWKPILWVLGAFVCCFFLPVGTPRFDGAVGEALHLVKWYAREHVLLCLAPAFFIAGAIGVFVSQASVMKYLGARANRVLAYGVASVSARFWPSARAPFFPCSPASTAWGRGSVRPRPFSTPVPRSTSWQLF